MQVSIAGIVHFDPLCKHRLETWLRDIGLNHHDPPLFVAVEWDRQLFNLVKSQRPLVRQLAASRWPEATTEFLDALESAVAFEADTHVQLLPEIPTLWLDQGRSLPSSDAIDAYARDRVRVYSSFVPSDVTAFDYSLLDFMSNEAWRRAETGSLGGTDRDLAFASRIAQYKPQLPSDWSIAIVGASHARRDCGYMGARLEEAKVHLDVGILRPAGGAAQ